MATVNTIDLEKFIPGKYGQLITLGFQFLSAGLYAISRGIAKKGTPVDSSLKNTYSLVPRFKNANKKAA